VPGKQVPFHQVRKQIWFYAKEKAWLGYISAMYSIRSSAEVQYSIKFFSEKASNGYYYKEAQIIIKFQKQF
jgi:hypothetical protein